MSKEATKDLGNTGGKEAKQERHEGAGHATGGAVESRQKQAELPDQPGQIGRPGDRQPSGPMFADTEEHREPIDPRTGLRGRPESPSDNPFQQTRDNVNPNIPSIEPGEPRRDEGMIVDPNSLGMEQGGVAAKEVPVKSVNEPATPNEPTTNADPAAQSWPYVGVDPAHPLNIPQSPNEPPGSDLGGSEGEGGEGEDEAPDLESLDPDEADAGDPTDIVMRVIGTGFTPESVIYFNGLEEPTTFVSETEVTTGVKPSLFVVPAVCPVTVRNGEAESDALEFEFLDPEAPIAARETKKTERRSKPKPAKKAKKAAKKGRR